MIRDFWWRTGQRAISVEARRLGLLLGGLLVCGALLAALAHAAQVTCGQTISQDTNVGNNLKNCPVDGLIIDTDGVAIDLQGHTIDGVGEGAGIRLLPDVDGVTIKNGTIKQFDDGILGEDSNDQFELHHLTLKDNDSSGVNIRDATDVVMRDSRASGHANFGFIAAGCTEVRMKRLVAEENRVGLRLSDVTDGTVLNSTARANTDVGLDVAFITTRVRAIDNTLSETTSGDGLSLGSDVSQVALKHNIAKGNDDDGIQVRNSSAALTANVANNNGGFGIEAVAGVIDFGDNSASGNGAAPPECENVDCD